MGLVALAVAPLLEGLGVTDAVVGEFAAAEEADERVAGCLRLEEGGGVSSVDFALFRVPVATCRTGRYKRHN